MQDKIHSVLRSSRMKRRRRQIGQISLLLLGILLIGSGVSIFAFFESIYELILSEAIKFSPNSRAYQAWRTNDPPLSMDIYLFNWTNPQQINNHSIKPEFQQIGPYRFLEVKEKMNIDWHDENSTVSFTHKKFYYFDAENSVRNLSDVVSTINAVPLTVAYKIRHINRWTKRVISFAMSSVSSLYVTKTIAELLFEGYDDPILRTLSKFPLLNVQDRFGIFYGKNGTQDKGIYGMYYKNDDNFGRITMWNYKSQTNFFEGHCNDIKGSAGEFYPFNRKRDKIVMYSGELCKYAELEYVEDVIIKGVRGYKYTGDFIFDNGTTRPENACFCTGECIPSGVFNVSTCRDNSPSFLSFPHFYRADPYYTNSMKGMEPDKAKHEFYITIEPKSGIVMDVQIVMQVNMLLQPVANVRLYENVPKIYVPLFYFTQNVHLTDEIASSLRLIQNLPEYFNYTFYIMLGLGTVCILWALCSYFWCYTNKQTFQINGKIPNTHDDTPLNDREINKQTYQISEKMPTIHDEYDEIPRKEKS